MKDINIKAVLKTYWRELKRYRWRLLLAFLAMTVVKVSEVIQPIIFKNFFDLLSTSSQSPESFKPLVSILFIVLGLNGIVWLGYRLASFVWVFLQSRVMADLKERAFDMLMKHSYSFFADNFSGSLVQKLNRLPRSFERFSDRFFWDLYSLFIGVVGITIVLYLYEPIIALAVLLWVIVFISMNFFLSLWKLKFDIRKAEEDSRNTAVLADAITNQNTIQFFTGFKFESKGFYHATERWWKATNLAWNISAVIESVQALLFVFLEFFIFYFSLKFWQVGLIGLGFFVMIQAYLLQLLHRLWDFGRIIRDFYESFADASEIVEIMEAPYDIKDKPGAKLLAVKEGKISFEELEFSFHLTRKIIRKINLEIKPGEKIALIGPSGAGKSTLVKLLLRLYDVESGRVLIDGQDISNVTQESLRKNIAVVPQDPILFHRTLKENIRYGRRQASDEEVYRVSGLSHCDDFVKDLPDGYDTYVGERGIKLSGGERQRVAIARAMLKNAPILILDEATSSLDSRSELLIQDALDKLMAEKTVLIIAHRLSTIRKADRIIVINDGRIVEEGKHNELLEKANGLYQKLWQLQAGGFLAE